MTKPRAKRTKRRTLARSRVCSTRDLAVLESLAWAGVLSTHQVERLHFPSRRTAQRRLRALLDHDLVRASLQGGVLHQDNVYTLTHKGRALLDDEGVELSSTSLRRLPRPQRLEHALAIRDVFVAFVRAENGETLEIVDFAFDDDLAADDLWQSVGIVPDALVVITNAGRELSLAVEVDLGTETTKTLGRKFAKYSGLFAAHVRNSVVPNELMAVVRTPARRATLERLVLESRLTDRATVGLVADLDQFVARMCTCDPFVRAVRAERTAFHVQPAESQTVFRTRGAVLRT